jgi:S-DNA-T family DNA segregation ATPase FtsK/SpoIIIE
MKRNDGEPETLSQSGNISGERKLEILGVVVLALTTLLFLALVTDGYQHQDHPRRYMEGMTAVPNLLGKPGAVTAGLLAILFGDAAHVIYAITFIWGLMLISHRPLDRFLTRAGGLLLLTSAMAGILQTTLPTGSSNMQPGGALGAFVADKLFVPNFGTVSSNVVGVTTVVIGVLLATDFLFVHLVLLANRFLIHLFRCNLALFNAVRGWIQRRQATAWRRAEAASVLPPVGLRTRRGPLPDLTAESDEDEAPSQDTDRIHIRTDAPMPPVPQDLPFDEPPFDTEPVKTHKKTETIDEPPQELSGSDDEDAAELPASSAPLGSQLELAPGAGAIEAEAPRRPRKARRKTVDIEELPPDYEYPKNYTKPSTNMLDRPVPRVQTNLTETLRATSLLLEETLLTFGIEARVTDVVRGPTITRFELEPAPGVKVSRFLALADDVALALKAHRVRVEAPIPGKGRVGIEVPNTERDQVLLRELLESVPFTKGKGKLKLALGKDISGDVMIADLASMPHLLVAGATGAGKTVCVKALMASLLYQHTPDELQLMLVDPKMVELSIFNDIPHLITPVTTDPKKASIALSWLINEMEERYRLFAELRVRNIEVYNQSVENGEIEMEPEDGEGDAQSVHLVRKLPYIVCIIDELADLMMLARAEVEDAIARLAQLARAVGIHLIIATQRPSVDVLTGVIKANFPARMSFQVSSRVDSRCILDEIGAERLIGMGDMLYLPAGQSKPTRIQGAFVSDHEMNMLINYLKAQAPPQYRDEIENFGKTKKDIENLIDDDDPLFDEAVQVVLETGQASISMVQRRLRVGYTRAARLIDIMELKGIVGPHLGSKARDILVSAPPEDEVA